MATKTVDYPNKIPNVDVVHQDSRCNLLSNNSYDALNSDVSLQLGFDFE